MAPQRRWQRPLELVARWTVSQSTDKQASTPRSTYACAYSWVVKKAVPFDLSRYAIKYIFGTEKKIIHTYYIYIYIYAD